MHNELTSHDRREQRPVNRGACGTGTRGAQPALGSASVTWCNSRTRFGRVSIALHWLVAVAVVGLFALGLWMTGLSYYHPWYYRAVDLHQSLGLLSLAVVVLRLVWRLANPTPAFDPKMAPWERGAALAAHWLMYLLMLCVMTSGYFMLTAEGDPISVFGWFAVAALPISIERQADIAGWLHYWMAWGLMSLVVLHTLAAFKHHFINRDSTLMRILRTRR